jgi:2-amino-4-hydroxy-6-hydroxymethyldihydropteridine diphosphokinase
MARVWVSVGSNQQRERHIRGAIAELRARFGALRLSSVYETVAVGFDGDPFYNLVVGFATDQPPEQVQAALRAIEDAHGRERTGPKFSGRTLDLDLLTYDDRVGQVAGKPLPHPDILAYPFVLGPLAELAPDECHPVLGRSYTELWQAQPEQTRAGLRRVPFDWGQPG